MGKNMEPILVTGSTGFIGQHVLEYLRERDIPFETLDLAPPALWQIDLSFQLPGYINGFSRVIHLAGVLGTHELFQNVERAIDVNIKGTVNVLEMCAREEIPFTGITMAHVWKNPYETTKLAAERLADAYGREYNFPVNYYTVYNAYGEYQAHGEGHPQKIIPTFARAAWENRPIPIWGDGTQVVDLVYARDVAKMLVEEPDEVEGGRGWGMSVNHAANVVWNLVRPGPPKIEYLPMRRGEHEPSRHPVALKPLTPAEDTIKTLERTVLWYKDRPIYP